MGSIIKFVREYSPDNLDIDEYEVGTSYDALLALREYFIDKNPNPKMVRYVNDVISRNLYSGMLSPVCTSKLYDIYEKTVLVDIDKLVAEMASRAGKFKETKSIDPSSPNITDIL